MSRTTGVARVEGEPEYIFTAKDTGDRCLIKVTRPRNDMELAHLVQAVAQLVTGAAETMSKDESGCGHVGCMFAMLKAEIVREFEETFPGAEEAADGTVH